VTAIFAANNVEPVQYRAILARQNQQDAYLNDFRSIAGVEEKASLEAVINGTAAKEVNRYRDILNNQPAEGGFGVDPADWFKTISVKIEGFHDTENMIAGRIDATASSQLSASRTELIYVLILGGAGIDTDGISFTMGSEKHQRTAELDGQSHRKCDKRK
jgi:hypothetical protein